MIISLIAHVCRIMMCIRGALLGQRARHMLPNAKQSRCWNGFKACGQLIRSSPLRYNLWGYTSFTTDNWGKETIRKPSNFKISSLIKLILRSLRMLGNYCTRQASLAVCTLLKSRQSRGKRTRNCPKAAKPNNSDYWLGWPSPWNKKKASRVATDSIIGDT